MKYTTTDKLIAYLALISGLSISAVAIYYSVAGLMAIFAAALIPIMIMGVVLEIGKLSATVWLKQNWMRAPRFLKTYLLMAIVALMLLTSMGIFGYLSKAHLDQAVPTGDVAAKVALFDEKIKTERDNVETARTALKQMDEQVNARLNRSDDEKGAERAVQIRRQQQAERGRLQKDIAESQARIAKLNEERAPIAAELRKVEAEVGPIKYIAALIYGDDADQNLLEKAVRWVIIVIVLVFDPLAVILLLASQYSFAWFRKQEEENPKEEKEQPLPEPKETEYVHSPWPFPVTEIKDTLPEAEEKHTESIEQQPIIEEPKQQEFKFLADDNDLYPEGKPWEDNKETIKDDGIIVHTPTTDTVNNEPLVEEEHDDEKDEDIIESAVETEKMAMKAWKHDNPDSSLKHYKRLYARGRISKLPWEDYLANEQELSEDEMAAAEAAKWAREQVEKTYVQNAEQSESTIWQRVKKSKEDDV
jgi:hypothetical protein